MNKETLKSDDITGYMRAIAPRPEKVYCADCRFRVPFYAFYECVISEGLLDPKKIEIDCIHYKAKK